MYLPSGITLWHIGNSPILTVRRKEKGTTLEEVGNALTYT